MSYKQPTQEEISYLPIIKNEIQPTRYCKCIRKICILYISRNTT